MALVDTAAAPGAADRGDAGSANPLLQSMGVPAFDRVRAEHVVPAIEELLRRAEAALEEAVGERVPVDYDALSAVLDVALERFGRAWGAVGHLNEVADSPALRAAYNACLPQVTEFFTRLGADERLCRKYRLVAESNASNLSAPRRQALQLALRDFVLGGAELAPRPRERFAQIQQRSAELSERYAEHVLDATDAFACFASADELAGVPDDVVRAARAAAQADGRSGFKLTLQAPCYIPLMQYASDRGLRERLYTAYMTRASDLGDAQFDNSTIMSELLALRDEQAKLLGYANFVELSLVPKMAESATQVRDFVLDLAARARPHAERDAAELREFAATRLGLSDLQAWDIAFASEQLKQQRFAFGSSELRQYFTEARVLQGLFQIAETLFDIQIRADSAPLWHPSVRVYSIHRGAQQVGQFYMDLHARAGKRAGAWMDDAQQRWLRPEQQALQPPVAHLVCDFAPPEQPGASALLSHDDVITLFHEFGHGLHHLLTQVDDLAVSGIRGVEWDAVELPSQFMENFCWEWEVLSRLSAHVDTQQPLPRELFDKMLAAKNFQSGLHMLRHAGYALFDLRIHGEADAATRLQHIADEVHSAVGVLPTAPFNRFQHSFSHIFDGSYAAGYYSYAWAEVLSADVWSAFEEAGIFDPETGRRYLHTILEVGGSRTALHNFKAFRGREPRIDALLRHQGLA